MVRWWVVDSVSLTALGWSVRSRLEEPAESSVWSLGASSSEKGGAAWLLSPSRGLLHLEFAKCNEVESGRAPSQLDLKIQEISITQFGYNFLPSRCLVSCKFTHNTSQIWRSLCDPSKLETDRLKKIFWLDRLDAKAKFILWNITGWTGTRVLKRLNHLDFQPSSPLNVGNWKFDQLKAWCLTWHLQYFLLCSGAGCL